MEPKAPLFKFGPSGVGGTLADDPFRDHHVNPMAPPPAPKRPRSESEDRPVVPKSPWMEPGAPGMGGTPAMAAGAHPATGLLRPKQPPHLSPAETREAEAEAKALDPEDQDLMSDEVLAQYE